LGFLKLSRLELGDENSTNEVGLIKIGERTINRLEEKHVF